MDRGRERERGIERQRRGEKYRRQLFHVSERGIDG